MSDISSLREASSPEAPGASGPGATPLRGGRTRTRLLDEVLPLAVLGAISGIVAFSYAHVFAGEPCGDDNSFHFAEIAQLHRAMRAGDWDWWNAGGNSGFASGYYYQVLPQALVAAFAALTGTSILTSFQLGIFLPLVLAPAAGYRAMRVLGAERWVAVGASLAIPFCIAGALKTPINTDVARWGHGSDGTFSVGLFTQLWAFALFPLALAHASRWIDEAKGFASAIAWGVFVGLCHPFAGVAVGLGLGTAVAWIGVRWALARAALALWPDNAWVRIWAKEAASPGGPALRLIALGAVLVLGSACAWLPVMVDYAGFGGFPHRVGDEVGPGFTLMWTWMRQGNLLDHARLPVLTAFLPLVIILARGRWLTRLWCAALVYALLLGVGPHLGKTEDDLLPAVRFLGSLQVVLAMAIGGGLVAVVLHEWRRARPEPWHSAARATALSVVLIAAVAVVIGGVPVQRNRVRVATDFEGIGRAELDELMPALRTATPGRLQVRAGAENHWFILLPYAYAERPASLVMGGAALQSSPNYVYQWELRDSEVDRAAWVFDAPLVLVRRDRGDEVGGQVIAASETYEVRELPAPGLVSAVQVMGALPPGRVRERAATVRWLWSEMPMRDEVLAHHGSGNAGGPPQGQANDFSRHGSTITATVQVDDDATAPTTFAIRESWHPRWRATLDGAAVPIRRITPDYMAVDVPAGTHALVLHFDRAGWTWLLWLLWPALVSAAWAGERAWRRRAGSRAPS